jgi:hypothetical protein
MKKQTAVENLIMELEQFAKFPMVDKSTIEAAIEFAKLRLAMEKENSEISFFAGYNYEGAFPVDEHEDYYNKTFTEK